MIGSGPAGLAAAQQLARAGHEVVVFEKDDRLGGLLRYGIPEFKLEKPVLDRRLEQMVSEGVKFEPSVNVGVDITAAELRQQFDAICSAWAPASRATCACPAAICRASILPWSTCRSRTAARPGEPIAERAGDPSPPTSTSSLSAGATRAATAWARRSARRPAPSRSWKSCPGRRTARTPKPPGPSGRKSCGLPARRRRAASASGAHLRRRMYRRATAA